MAHFSKLAACALAVLVGAAYGAIEGRLTSPGGSVFERFVSDSSLQAPEPSSPDRDSPVDVADANFHLGVDQSLVLRVDGDAGDRSQLRQLDEKSWLSTTEFGERRSVAGEILLDPQNDVTEVTFAQIGGNVTDDPVVRLVYHKGRVDNQNGDASDNRYYSDAVWGVFRPEIGADPSQDKWVRLGDLQQSVAWPFEIEVLNDRAEVSVNEKSTAFDITSWGGVQSHFVVGVYLNSGGKATASFPSLNYGY